MNTVEIITAKRNGKALSEEEIRHMVQGFTSGEIPDYQMSAFLMAVYFQGMDREETVCLTKEMKLSGDTADLSGIRGIKIDKHSTGGVGDKTTLICGPLAAACGVPIAKMSGRGLGFTGGTVDKLESVPGYQTAIEEERFFDLVNRNGISVIGQTAHIAPADKKIYALRDVTATVENLSLITSSIMSKKLASGSDGILLDVKCGKGAFMKTPEDAEALARMMTEIGNADGKRTMAVITDMEQPLGRAVGNALEVREAIEVLKGEGPEDITELSLTLAGLMVYMGDRAESAEAGYEAAREALRSGAGLEKLRLLFEGQGGDPSVIDDPGLLKTAPCERIVKAPRGGFVSAIDAQTIGLASQHTGAGRETKEDDVDHGAGILLRVKTGDPVKQGDPLLTLYASDEALLAKAGEEAQSAFAFSEEKPAARPLIYKIIGDGEK